LYLQIEEEKDVFELRRTCLLVETDNITITNI